ncbi:MAG: group 1 truncated hemoglobin [Gammaproteobacteria bacterium]|nr:group 1 truncated hemoglobin [Gammaproteobacteria bacterium]
MVNFSKPTAFFFALLTGCANPSRTTDSLYQQLGATAGLEQLVDGVLVEIERDQQIVHHFKDTDIVRFRRLLIEQLCQLSGGPCQYTGATMQESHTGFAITPADFDNLVNHFIKVMSAQQIPVTTQNALLAKLAPMYSDVINR